MTEGSTRRIGYKIVRSASVPIVDRRTHSLHAPQHMNIGLTPNLDEISNQANASSSCDLALSDRLWLSDARPDDNSAGRLFASQPEASDIGACYKVKQDADVAWSLSRNQVPFSLEDVPVDMMHQGIGAQFSNPRTSNEEDDIPIRSQIQPQTITAVEAAAFVHSCYQYREVHSFHVYALIQLTLKTEDPPGLVGPHWVGAEEPVSGRSLDPSYLRQRRLQLAGYLPADNVAQPQQHSRRGGHYKGRRRSV